RHLERATWPGNVRELKTLLEVALVLADGASRIGLEHLPDSDRGASDSRIDVSAAAAASCEDSAGGLADVEAAAVRRALNDAAGNVSRAAAALGIARSTLYRMMRRHGLRAE
ncbi:MAG: sigma-54-dependent Fis family transcriptional regulator, partial [Planctomycetes bacterium]|nr:sigma-54-dependent Fis family transcriptional regulator [Planctomycetota bacterium]